MPTRGSIFFKPGNALMRDAQKWIRVARRLSGSQSGEGAGRRAATAAEGGRNDGGYAGALRKIELLRQKQKAGQHGAQTVMP